MSVVDPKLILIVEDYEDDAKLLQLLLASGGVFNPVRTALSAEEAMIYLAGVAPFSNRTVHPLPAVIFVDLKLPGMDGFGLLRWVKTHPELKGTFIVVLSAAGDLMSVQTAYDLGANSFLTKPCREADIENLVAGYPDFWIRGQSLPFTPTSQPEPPPTSQPQG